MRHYVALRNELGGQSDLGLDTVEAFWIEQVHRFFRGKPFKIRLDASHRLGYFIQDVLRQAADRERQETGLRYSGAVLQHLVGAKLECALGKGRVTHTPFFGVIQHRSFSTADAPASRSGDFSVEDVAIHVTTALARKTHQQGWD